MKNMGLAAATLVVPGSIYSTSKGGNKPNIVLILVDDLGYGDLSGYGATDMKTPNIDELIESGMRFDNFYANCPVCSPTRASLLTGRYPDLVGVPGVIRTHPTDNFGYLAQDAVLLPALLKSSGYHTAIIGKWHLGLESENTPNKRDFDFFHGFLGDMMDDYYNHRRHNINYMRLNDKTIDPEGHATDLFTDWSIKYINERAKSEQPFFLYLAYNAPHTPIQPPEEWIAKVKNREKGIEDNRAKLVALIEHLDYGIGKVISALKELKLSENTLVIFTSDNGGLIRVAANNGRLHGGKQDMYEGGIRVPMCAVLPGKIKKSSRCDQVAMTMDLFPTISEIAGADINHKIDGKSLMPVLLGKSKLDEDRILFWVRREGNKYGGKAYYAARYGDWKLLQNNTYEPMKLFNLKDDPLEEHPLSPKHEMYKKLFNALRNHIIQSGAIPWQKRNPLSRL